MNMIIGVGNCGVQILKAVSLDQNFSDFKLYGIDSVMSSIDLQTINNIDIIPIISDEKSGSGRNRERGQAMFKFHEDNGAFKTLYTTAISAKSPVIVITSAAGGTGSGATVPLCKALVSKGVNVIPVIICPNVNDPQAYHLNTNDLLVELGEVGIETYTTFNNPKGDSDYEKINNDVVDLLKIIFGKKYLPTTFDSIDDSDLDVILSTPGRFIAVSAVADNITTLKKEIVRKVFTGYQPAWVEEDSIKHTFITAYSLTSMFADKDFKTTFEEINTRIKNVYDEYRNIVNSDGSESVATIIVAGLPQATVKKIDSEYVAPDQLGNGLNKSRRPNFMKKKATIDSTDAHGDGTEVMKKFTWK